jgi:exodeoxyribonuclease VII small subunit
MAENKINNMDLESAMKRLDQVVNELSEQNVKLERSLALYEEGVALVRYCSSKLESVERKIEALRMTEDGEIVKVPFDAE